MFETEFGIEKYLFSLNSNLCIALCKHRTSNLKLEIEKLRSLDMYSEYLEFNVNALNVILMKLVMSIIIL